MRIDMHTHCLPVSKCAHHDPEQLPGFLMEGGVDAIVLTNHCYPYHCETLSPDLREQAEIYVDIFRRCRDKGREVGFKVFFGAEIRLMREPNLPEFLLYGLSEQDFIESYPLYDCTQKELFDFCNEKDILMVQAHPFRFEQCHAPADMRYVHGIEVYNPHPSFDSRIPDAIRLARENDKIMTSGSDFHVNGQAGAAGMIIPDHIEDQFALRDFLKTAEPKIYTRNGLLDL